ncbi:Cytochrome P450 CYP4/CYP19/CYP26 subfamily [Handroanthus impetiginosus]|uniref:Cytochrome P450 CYP4/CYP19/CYP26 subfamily n=1 Tax=Handroanthus impetiginosus TaxID=429701 RepID=A0A2G9IAU7_9LAMI|nr:Cytochrome P450 CYP4/CYP19/CYP26 subfamily [Handroanthus impetiginosus]
MAGMVLYSGIFMAGFWFLALWAWRNHRKISWNWPLIGMLPALFLHVGRIHDSCTEVLRRTRRGTFCFKGPRFSDMEILVTVNPENVHYIMSANFENFPKGPKFREIFYVLGEGIFNSDSDSWRHQRKVARALINHQRFHRRLVKIIRDKVEKGLIPVLEMVCEKTMVVDLQDVFLRLTFDTTCALVTGYDPGCLSIDLHEVPFSRAMDDAEEAIFMRHVLPERVWKLARWLGVGSERKLKEACGVLDHVIGKYIAMKREELRKKGEAMDGNEDGADLLTSYMNGGDLASDDDKFLRDTILNLMIAGRDTTSSALTWFLWLVSTHPEVEKKIRDELKSVCPIEEADKWRVFQVEETSKLTYMHGALCEALRLYPPVPFQHKMPIKPDILPSGHYVHPKMKVMFFLYAMGRMESIWGKDCLEFKPERWISECGTIKHEPSYKFLAFNAGPRTCLGREVAFIQMKVVAATMIHNYQVCVVEGHRVAPNCSIILYMKDGLKVRISKRMI